ncbi:MAG: hypothetical protein AAFO84_06100 [Cyanobacteria bacterium J06598_1]
MFIKIVQAGTITLALYALLGLNMLQTSAAAGESVEPVEVMVALKQVLVRGN